MRSWSSTTQQLWFSAGLKPVETEVRLDRLVRSLRWDERRDRPDKVRLRVPSPARAPSRDSVLAYLTSLEEQITKEKAGATRTRLQELLLLRALLHTLVWTGMRWSSLASMRADMLRAEGDIWRVNMVLVKGTPSRRNLPPTPRLVVGDDEYTHWLLWPHLIRMYEELFEAHQLDLRGYLSGGSTKALRWVDIKEDATFGRAVPIGARAAPLWFDGGGTSGYLSKKRIYRLITQVVRNDLGLPRGGLHIFRRLASSVLYELMMKDPGMSEMVLQMSAAQQTRYAISVNRNVSTFLGTYDPKLGELRSPAAPTEFLGRLLQLPNGLGVDAAKHAPVAVASPRDAGGPKRPRAPHTRAEPTLEDLFGDAGADDGAREF